MAKLISPYSLLLVMLLLGWSIPMASQAAGPVSVTVSLSANPHPALAGQAVTLQVQVSAAQPGLNPAGIVQIQSDEQQTCSITLDNQGKGSCSLTFSGVERVILQAVYAGETSFLPGVSGKLLLPVIVPGQIQVYQHDFETSPGDEWSPARRDTALNGENFLGQLGNETARLQLTQLPAHHWVRVSFDLYIIRSWDGNQVDYPYFARSDFPQSPDLIIGPDRWRLQADGATLLDTTFSNWADQRQAYPAFFGVGDFPPQTSARDINHLGYTYGPFSKDATYRQSFTFIHQADTLTLDFSALGLQDIMDESWGLDNVTISVDDTPAYLLYLPVVSR
jgi:hypothetical protein